MKSSLQTFTFYNWLWLVKERERVDLALLSSSSEKYKRFGFFHSIFPLVGFRHGSHPHWPPLFPPPPASLVKFFQLIFWTPLLDSVFSMIILHFLFIFWYSHILTVKYFKKLLFSNLNSMLLILNFKLILGWNPLNIFYFVIKFTRKRMILISLWKIPKFNYSCLMARRNMDLFQYHNHFR